RPEDRLCTDDLEGVATRPAAASGLADPHQRDAAIERTGIEGRKAERLRHGARGAGLAGGRRPVNRDHPTLHRAMLRRVSGKPGKLTAAQPGSSIVTLAPGSVPSTANAM